MHLAHVLKRSESVKASALCQRTLRSVSQERLRTLLLQVEQEYDFHHFSLSSFAQWVATKRQREMKRIGWQLPASISGVWVATQHVDFVFYETRTPAVHQIHIQLHELAHILCNHKAIDLELEPEGISREAMLQYLAGAFDTNVRPIQAIEQLLLRSARDNEEEQEAELLSALIQQRIAHKRFHASLTQPLSFSDNALVLGVYQTLGWI